jgi:uncharacterized repeat protein (TIGR03803 family)
MSTKYFICCMSRLCVALVMAIMLVNGAWAASKEKVLYSFTGGSDGGDPATGLTFDGSGNAYGTSVVGGSNGFGTVFQLTPGSHGTWTESVLYSFAGGSSDGMYPYGGVTFDKSGNLYGTTVGGGSGSSCGDGCGTVFKLAPSVSGWSESVIYSFAGGNDGFGPGGPLIFDKKGNLYGTTPDGGTNSDGTVYTLTPGKNGQWKEKVIHSFAGGNEGATGSLGPLLLDKAGNLYGVTETQGASGYGTVFKLSPVSKGSWKLTTLYGFLGEPDAGSPYGGLIADAKGRLYGTTYYGGANGLGAVFELTKGSNSKWTESVLYSFKGGKDGSATTTTLLLDKSSNLYGTTSAGGDLGCACGTVFKLASRGGKWTESVSHRFTGNPDGSFPYYGLSRDKTGNLYSTTATGGNQNQGVIFELTP